MSFHDRQLRGERAFLTGCAAEAAVARVYLRAGYRLVAERWRGGAGEIDLVLRDGRSWVFVEVKAGPDWARAAQRITRRQIRRIQQTALEYVAAQGSGPDVAMRFDAALVDGVGRVDVIENAFF